MIGIGLVGVGGWGRNHLRVLATLKALNEVDYLAVADISKETLNHFKRIYAIDAIYTSVEELINDGKIDAGIVASPTPLHFQHASLFIEKEKHVLVEKPFTTNVKEAEKLIEMADKKGVLITVGLLLRFSPAVEFAKELFKKSDLGEVLSVSAKRTSKWPSRKLDVEIIRDLAIHDVDLVRFITGYEPKKVLAYGGASSHNLIDYASILYIYENSKGKKLPVSIEVSWITPYKVRRFEITATKGMISLDLLSHRVEIADENGVRYPSIKYKEPLMEQDQNFVRAVRGTEPLKIPASDVIVSLQACIKAIESIEKGKSIEI